MTIDRRSLDMNSITVFGLFMSLLLASPLLIEWNFLVSFGILLYIPLSLFYLFKIDNRKSRKELLNYSRLPNPWDIYSFAAEYVASGIDWIVGKKKDRVAPKYLVAEFSATLTILLWNRTLLVAAVYPALFALFFWTFATEEIRFSDSHGLSLFPDTVARTWRISASVPIILILTILFLLSFLKHNGFQKAKIFALSAILLFGSVTLFFVFLIAGLDGFIVVFSAIVAFCVGASALPVGGGSAVGLAAVVGSLAVCFLGSHYSVLAILTVYIVLFAQRFFGPLLTTVFCLVLMFSAPVFSILVFDFSETDPRAATLFLLFGVLTPINAVFDYFSYAITFALFRQGKRKAINPFLAGFFDTLIAAILLCFLGFSIVFAVKFANVGADFEFLDIDQAILNQNAFSSSWWIFLMMLSTLVPTFLHFGLACFSLLTPLCSIMSTRLTLVAFRSAAIPNSVKYLCLNICAYLLAAIDMLKLYLSPLVILYLIFSIFRIYVPNAVSLYVEWLQIVAQIASGLSLFVS